MKVSFEHDAAHNYMIPQPEYQGKETESSEGEYEFHMLEENEIPGLMNCSRKKINGDTQYYYEITSQKSLAQLCETEALRSSDIRNILKSFYQTLQQMEQYLLNTDKIVLEPELIYLDIESKEAKFCYLPSYERMIQDSFRMFASYLLYHLEQTDTAAVLLVYELNRRVQEKNYALLEILQQETGMEEGRRTESLQVQRNTEKAGEKGGEERRWEADLGQERGLEGKKREKKPTAMGKRREVLRKIRKQAANTSTEKKKNEKKETAACKTEKNGAEKKGQMIMGILFLVVTGLTGLAAWMEILTMTQAGGITFLIAGAMGYALSWQKKKKETEKRGTEKKNPEDTEIKWEMPESIPKQREEAQEALSGISEAEEKVGATTVLRQAQAEYEPHITLISMNSRERNSVVLLQDSYLIGKLKSKVDICIDDVAISRIHAKIQKEDGEYYLYDMNSTNGTYLNGRRLGVNEKVPIHVADEITFAEVGYYVGKC